MATVRERLNRLKEIGEEHERYLASLERETNAKKTADTIASRITQEAKAQAVSRGIELPRARVSALDKALEGTTLLPTSAEGAARDFAYGSERAGASLLGAAEGVTDFIGSGFYKGLQGLTSLGGLAPNPVSEWAGRSADAFLNNSITQDYEQSIRERYNPTPGMENVTGVGQTVVQMLPGIGAARAVSAAGSALNAAQAAQRGANAGRVIFGLQAAGQSAQQAKQEGATTNQALAYGAASGALESAIEGIAGGIPGMGTGKLREIAGAVKASPAVSRALDILGEGGEEALSTALTPYLQRAIYNPDAENATAEEIAQSAVLGAVAAGVLQAGLELPTAVSDRIDTRNQVRQMAEANLANPEFVERTTRQAMEQTNANLNRPRPVLDNPLADMLPTAEQALNRRAGSPVYQRAELPGGERQTSVQSSTETEPIREIENTAVGQNVNRRQGTQIPVEERTWEDASSRKVNAFQYDHPELRPYYADAARALQYELSSGIKASRFPIKDADGSITGYTGVPRSQASPIVRALDDANLSYADIDKALTAIINDQGQENYAAAKKMELVLDEMLSDGYTDVDGRWVEPDNNYVAAREAINRGEPVRSFEDWASLESSEPPGLELPTSENVFDIYGSGSENLPETAVGANKASPWVEFVASSTEFFPEGANAAREVDVPTTDPQGRRIRKTAATAMGAKAIPDEVVGDIQDMVLRGELSYNRVSDKASIDRAVKTIRDKTYQGALEEFRSAINKGVVSKDIATLGQQLLINAANAGDGKTTAELLSLYAQMETTAGQAVQAASILRKLAPSDQLYAAQRMVSDLEKTISKRYKDIDITIDQSLIEEFNNQTTQEGRDAVLDKIYQNVADQVPSNWRDKWNAWRYMSMLANPRTHIRNVAGNVFFQPIRIVKDRTAAAIEAGVSALSGGRLQKSKSFVASPELYREAWSDWDNVKGVLSGNKYNDVRSEIESRRKVFNFRPLEAVRTGNSWALEFEDSIFKRVTYADALAGYLQANGVTAEQMRNNTVDANLMARARDYAGQEALKATYQDRNAVSDKVVQVANVLGPAGEAILPFKRTPANILVRGVEYSPAGLIKALSADLIEVRQGKMTGAEAIDHIASGLTGSGLFALGAYLFSQGIVTSGGGDDENQDRLNELTGQQNYALNLPGGGNVTLDWLAPEALPFFMGVELMDSMGQHGNTAESISTALKSISDPMLELSMLQSLNDVIDSVSFSENKLGALASSAVVSYFTQAIPTIGGQIERSAENERMSTYTDKNLTIGPLGLPIPTDVQYAIGRASARLPGWDYQQIPYIDAWGRREDSGPLWLRTANNFLNPAYTSNSEVTPVDEEIQRLYDETGESGVVPDRPQRYITVDGERVDLSADQYVQYAEERGQMQFDMLEGLFDNRAYQRLSDTDKAAVVSDVYSYADDVTKSHISDYQPDGWVAKAEQSGVDPEKYILYKRFSSNGNLAEQSAALDRAGISGGQKTRVLLAENPEWAGKAREAGVSDTVYAEYKIATYGIEADKDANGESISGSKRAKVLRAIDGMDVNSQVKDALYYAAGYSKSTIGEAPWH